MRVEQLVLKHLINNEEYARKTIPFLQKDYFTDSTEGLVFDKIKAFIATYNSIPSKEALIIEIDNDKTLNDEQFKNCGKVIQKDPQKYFTKDVMEKIEKAVEKEFLYGDYVRDTEVSVPEQSITE